MVAAGLHINGTLNDKTLIVIDGDKYNTQKEKQQQMKNVYTGNEPNKTAKREEALLHITQFKLPLDKSPEEFIWENLKASADNNEIIKTARNINAVADSHSYVNTIIDNIGIDRKVALDRIIEQLTKEPCWDDYVSNIITWLDARIANGDV